MIKSPYQTEEILNSSLERNYKLIKRASQIVKWNPDVVFDQGFIERVEDAKRHVETLRDMGNAYYEKDTF